jgi:hypothetical protein
MFQRAYNTVFRPFQDGKSETRKLVSTNSPSHTKSAVDLLPAPVCSSSMVTRADAMSSTRDRANFGLYPRKLTTFPPKPAAIVLAGPQSNKSSTQKRSKRHQLAFADPIHDESRACSHIEVVEQQLRFLQIVVQAIVQTIAGFI